MANIVEYKKLWEPQLITTSEVINYTAATSSSSGVVKNISAVISNTSTSNVTVEVWIVPSADAGATSDKAKLISDEVIQANSRLSFTVPDMNRNDDIITQAATTNVLTIHCTSGIVIN